MSEIWKDDLRLIEAGFPCHQVGAETQRERDTGKAPPTHRVHVWWARRPLTPSRAAILASLLPADTNPNWFLRQLGIEKRVVEINGVQWTLTGKLLERIYEDEEGREVLEVDQTILRWLEKENQRRKKSYEKISKLKSDASLATNPILLRWEQESEPIPEPWPPLGQRLIAEVVTVIVQYLILPISPKPDAIASHI